LYRLYEETDTLNGAVCLEATVLEFWRWAFGNLNEDTLKGLFAEWLVGRLLGLELPLGGRNGGANSDLFLESGIRVEVKSAAYWQSWKLYDERGRPRPLEEIEERHWRRLEKPLQFQVRRSRDSVDRSGDTPALWSDLYVFCAQFEKNPVSWNILDLNQWRFYCLTRDEVETLPTSFSEHRLRKFRNSVTAAELRGEAGDRLSLFLVHATTANDG